MRRHVMMCLVLAGVGGCESVVGVTADPLSAGAPAFAISDGAHGSGNPDFFFLPPMVPNASGSGNWNAGAFNGAILPVVKICSLTVTTEAAVASAPCAGSYSQAWQLTAANVSLSDEQYKLHWTVPVSSTTFYRIAVMVGSRVLGMADVETAASSGQLKNVNTGEFVPLVDGRTLPIKFRIERYALCATPGVGPCASTTVPLAAGGTVQTILPGTTVASGVTIPPQPPSPGITAPTFTVQACPDLNPVATDLPTFGSCVRVTAEPALPPAGLANAAAVFICDVGHSTGGLTESQEKRLTLHRLDVDGLGAQTLAALPHAPGCPVTTASTGSLRGVFAALRSGQLRMAARQAVALVSPRPLYAAKMVDLGGGGFTDAFSDFQFALPAKFTVDAAGNNQSAEPGSPLPVSPSVHVTDLGGDPVRGARVTFSTSNGSLTNNPVSGDPTTVRAVVTDANGFASTGWTIGGTSGKNTLRVWGRGIAGSDNNGPREGIDPFQPIQAFFDNGANVAAPVPVLTGAVFIGATGEYRPREAVSFGSDGFSYTLLVPASSLPELPDAPAGWEQPGFAPTGWSTAAAPFGEGTSCFASSVVTAWPVYSDLLLRKSFNAAYAGRVSITLLIDNDAQVFLDGVDITASGTAGNATISGFESNGTFTHGGFWVHDLCADQSPPTFTATVSRGIHVLAIRASDRGGLSFADVRVTLTPP